MYSKGKPFASFNPVFQIYNSLQTKTKFFFGLELLAIYKLTVFHKHVWHCMPKVCNDKQYHILNLDKVTILLKTRGPRVL